MLMNKKQLIESQKECADMLGMTLDEYEKYLKDVKSKKIIKSHGKQSNQFLDYLKIDEKDLKLMKTI